MEIIIIGLLIILIILCVLILNKSVNESNITERLGKIETTFVKEIGDFKSGLSKDMNNDFNALNEKIDYRLNLISDKVSERLEESLEKTGKTFNNVLERLTKIDEAQKKIDNLSNDIVSLQSVLTDKKSRGIFGEVNLKQILNSVFGEKSEKVYKLQHTFSTGVMADCALFAPEPLGTVAIDSKFPLENYRIMVDTKVDSSTRKEASKKFKMDLKKHIDAISEKYIIPGETSDQAIMFLPAEAIFAEVNAYHSDIVEYAYKNRVWITSPTTLISTLTTIQVIITNLERDKYATVIHKELNLLSNEFKKYKDRWDKLSRSIDTVNNDVKEIHITTDKITKRFTNINEVDIDEEKLIEK